MLAPTARASTTTPAHPAYTKGCKIHPRITTFYGIIFSPVFCRNFLPKPSEFCCTKKGQFLHHDGICRYLYHYTLFHQNFPPPGSHSGSRMHAVESLEGCDKMCGHHAQYVL